MKRSRIRAPRPTKVVLQYRLIALAILGLGVIGVLYSSPSGGDISFSPSCVPGESCCFCEGSYTCIDSESGTCPLVNPLTGKNCRELRENEKTACKLQSGKP